MKKTTVTAKILLITISVVIVLAASLVFVMTYFMGSLTDTILLNALQPMAKTASASVEGSLHTLADRLFLVRDNSALVNSAATNDEKQVILDRAMSGIEFVWLGIYDENGALLTGSHDCPLSISGRQLYQMIRESGNLVFEDTSVGTSGLEVVVGIPLLDDSNTVTYLAGSYKYDLINDALSNINIGSNGTAFIIDETGALIAHKDRGKVFSQEPLANSLGNSEEAYHVLQSMIQGQTGSTILTGPDGGKLFLSYSPIRGTRWSLGIQVPRSDFVGAVRQAILISVIVTILSLALFAVIISLIIRHIFSVPLKAITQNAHQLADGEFESNLSIRFAGRSDEIGQLASAFHSMSLSIHRVVEDIDQLTKAARVGSLNQRAELSDYQGDYLQILAGINATLDVICSHLDTMPGALALFDGEQKPIYRNRAMSEILSRHSFTAGSTLLEYISISQHRTDLMQGASRLFEPDSVAGDTFSADIALVGRDSEVHNYTMTLRRVGNDLDLQADHPEAETCVMLILSDVTQLTRAKVDAESASRAKTDFLSRMSHEMRTPMNAIIGMTSIAKSSGDPERKEYCLDKINEASQHLLGVINDILDMSKIEADKFELSYSEFNFEKMLQRVTSVINFRVEERQQNLLVEIDSHLPTMIVSDEQRLAQVITNLLGNAVKFTPEQGTITLKAEKLADSQKMCTLRVEVRDTGIGISEEQQKKLFTSFEQADGSISRRFGGTGLGLAISRRIVEMMNGRIWVESQVDKGSSFIFQLEVEKAGPESRKVLPPTVNWRSIRVLAVDDAPEVLDLFQMMLGTYGIECETALSAGQAMEMIREAGSPYDLLFADWRMPEMSGIELAEALKDLPVEQQPVFVLVTAADWSEIEERAQKAGVSRFLQKPIFPSLLVDCINDCLTPAQRQEPAGPEEDLSEEDLFLGRRVLLAEDVEINREILAALIGHTGVELDYAEDGRQAVEKFSAQPDAYDLILMDVHMPNLDGYEATRQIRASGLPRSKAIPIIAMTANVFREDIERCLESGMNSHLGKPIDPDEVIRTLREYML